MVALTPAGQRHEFNSTHIANLIKTPWVDPIIGDASVKIHAAINPHIPDPIVNPFLIGDVATVEDGIGNDTLPTLDVTGTSSKPEPKVTEEVIEQNVTEAEASEATTEADEMETSEDTSDTDSTPKPKKGRKASK